ncbi:hypothetical protein E8E13_005317 [Curvularia kusanoi]|uniref:Heterokaryon incompatibility domain-containing protein n=1 Tax=Curvularia kusanoi TaxID=90978 RepID=A0A9P4WC17_CURKU|nr:hypothetical protein E8E13_005317 [Curvularia kusanoi]
MLSTAINMPLMPKIPTYYWIDALCVDQSNILERNVQVARMADVFCKASGVIVWLGREDEFTADALEVIQKVSAIPERDWPSVPYTSFYDSSALDHPSKPRLSYKNWLGFIALINRPWFRRAWVVQEITLGKSPIVKHRYSKSTDPRDKVYALLGLASPTMAPFRTNPAAITPNYSMSVQQVYMATAKAFLTDYRNLTLLSHVEDPSMRRIADLPSWVPDYSVTLEPYPLPYRGKGHWTASGNLPWHMNTFRMDDGLLDVQGYCLDHIDQTSILSDESSDPSALWASIVRLALSLDLQYPGTKGSGYAPSRVEVLWRTLTTDTYAHTCPAPPEVGALFIDYILNLQIRHRLMPWSSNEEFQPHHSPLSESIYPEWRTLLSLEPPRSAYSLNVYKKRLTKVVEDMFNGTYSPIGLAQLQHEIDQSGGRKRRLFKTRRGYLGTGSRSLKPGDEVWILHKGGLPFVLRPQQRFGHYRLIGEAFVYGIMHGEALGQGLTLHNITLE